MLKRRLHTADLVDRSQCEHGGGPSFYISRRWVNRFNTFAEPGPIDNEDFVCCHGKLDPMMANRVTQDDFVLFSQSVWEYLRETFKGGPALTSIEPCAICLEKRRALIGKKLAEIAAGDVTLIQSPFTSAETRCEQQLHPQNSVPPQKQEQQPNHRQDSQPHDHLELQDEESQLQLQHDSANNVQSQSEGEEEETMREEDEILTIENTESQNVFDNEVINISARLQMNAIESIGTSTGNDSAFSSPLDSGIVQGTRTECFSELQ